MSEKFEKAGEPEIEPKEPNKAELLRAEFNRDVPEEYEEIIERASFIPITTAYSENLAADLYIRGERPSSLDFSKGEVDPEKLSSFGREFVKIIEGRDFIDLGSGRDFLKEENPPVTLARIYGARRYIGVDRGGFRDDFKKYGDLETYFMNNDMLSLVSQIPEIDGALFYISGIEPLSEPSYKTWNEQYIEALFREIDRLTKPGDAIVIGTRTFGFDPEKHGFQLIGEGEGPMIQEVGNHKIYIKPE